MEITIRTNPLTIVSFICGLLGLISLGAMYSAMFLPSTENLPEATASFIVALLYFPRSLFLLLAELSIIAGVLALNEIKKSSGLEKGKTFAWTGIVLGAGVILFQLSLPIILRLRS